MRELKIKNITWVSVVKPRKADLDTLSKQFPQIHLLILEELLKPTVRPRAEKYEDAIFMVFHFLNPEKDSGKHLSHEVDFVLLSDALITVQYDNHNLLEKFWNENKDDAIEEQYGQSPAHFLYYFLRGYFHSLASELDNIQIKTASVEEKVFAGKETTTLKDAAMLRKQILDFRRILGPEYTTLESLGFYGGKLYGEETKHLLDNLSREYVRVWNTLENQKEVLDALYDTNHSLLTLKTNTAIKNLTLIALMTFIPMTLTGLFGMNVFGTPLTRGDNAFWAVTVFIAFVTFMAYLVLKWRKLV